METPTVFPTPVGVFLISSADSFTPLGLPHARGGVSHRWHHEGDHFASSPRPWGCFRYIVWIASPASVFPTPVGVFLTGSCITTTRWSLPHARGGVSLEPLAVTCRLSSSPRPWGCFMLIIRVINSTSVFPTPVGVFP